MYDEIYGMKPTLYVSDKFCPAIKDMKVGEEYEVLVKIKQTSVNLQEQRDGSKLMNATFEVTAMEVPEEEKDVNDMDDDEFNEYAAKRKAKDY